MLSSQSNIWRGLVRADRVSDNLLLFRWITSEHFLLIVRTEVGGQQMIRHLKVCNIIRLCSRLMKVLVILMFFFSGAYSAVTSARSRS